MRLAIRHLERCSPVLAPILCGAPRPVWVVISRVRTLLAFGIVLIGRYQNSMPEARREPRKRSGSYRFIVWIVPSELVVLEARPVSWAKATGFGCGFRLWAQLLCDYRSQGVLSVSPLHPKSTKRTLPNVCEVSQSGAECASQSDT